jgi:hypothetical protein
MTFAPPTPFPINPIAQSLNGTVPTHPSILSQIRAHERHDPVTLPPPTPEPEPTKDPIVLAYKPIDPNILDYHKARVRELFGPTPEEAAPLEVHLTFNPNLNAYELLGSPSVMEALKAAGPQIKGTFRF